MLEVEKNILKSYKISPQLVSMHIATHRIIQAAHYCNENNKLCLTAFWHRMRFQPSFMLYFFIDEKFTTTFVLRGLYCLNRTCKQTYMDQTNMMG
jgi:hypothetical protein